MPKILKRPPMPGAGRPSKNTPAKRQIILEAIENKMPLYLAADYAQITRDTLHNWMTKDEDFYAQVRFAQAKAAGALINKVCEDGAGSWKILKNLKPTFFRDEPQVVINTATMIRIENADGTKRADLSLETSPTPTETNGLEGPHISGYLGDTGRQEHIGTDMAPRSNNQD